MLTATNYPALSHAYEMYKGIFNKPSINELLAVNSVFLEPVYLNYGGNAVWSHGELRWVKS